ncbi:MAG: hypothetical protein AB202_04080 [Parcubacteria bacterium C7867-007]|nr:MAG: hypothetical protein AB202_04080 [Parcubacteria bacterium C7867-007]
MNHQEIEVRFLEIDKEALIKKLRDLGAEDLGEDLLQERIIYDKEHTWTDKMLRLRTQKGKTILAYKHRVGMTAEGTEEIEFEVSNPSAAELLLSRLGYTAARHQQKLRHSFHLEDVVVDIDTWPRVPTYVELEGPSVVSLEKAAQTLGLDWGNVELRSPKTVIMEVYNIPLDNMEWFTFDKFE